jgi:hypothetical protein
MKIYSMALLRSYWLCLSARWFVRSWPCALVESNQYMFLVAALCTQYMLVMQLVVVRIMVSVITVSRLDSRMNHLEGESKME